MDYQQIYNMDSPIRAAPEGTSWLPPCCAAQSRIRKSYDPLTIDEYETIPLDISVLNLCLDWPIHKPRLYAWHCRFPKNARIHQGAGAGDQRRARHAADHAGRRRDIVTAQYKNAQACQSLPTASHIDALEDVDDCTQQIIIRRFVSTLDTGDASCAANVKPVRLVPNCHASRRRTPAIPAAHTLYRLATPRPRAQLAQISAAVQTAGDVQSLALEHQLHRQWPRPARRHMDVHARRRLHRQLHH